MNCSAMVSPKPVYLAVTFIVFVPPKPVLAVEAPAVFIASLATMTSKSY